MTLVVPERRIEPSDKTLYRHTKRPGWGVAIIARQRKDRRTYQFSDGQLRVIKEPFYALLEPVEEVAGSAETLRSDLARAARSNQASTSPSIGKPVCTFEEQLELFHGLYPDGFSDPQWIHHHRSSADGNTYKRHRNPVVAAMSETLAEERCRDLIEAERSGELIPPVAQILTTTTLVPIKHARALARLDEGDRAQCGAGAARSSLRRRPVRPTLQSVDQGAAGDAWAPTVLGGSPQRYPRWCRAKTTSAFDEQPSTVRRRRWRPSASTLDDPNLGRTRAIGS